MGPDIDGQELEDGDPAPVHPALADELHNGTYAWLRSICGHATAAPKPPPGYTRTTKAQLRAVMDALEY